MNQDQKQIGVSFIIATFNRSHLVRNLINYFDSKMIIPGSLDLEIVFVDNNSSDATSAVIKTELEKDRDYQLRYVLEVRQGLSAARNRGIKTANNDFLFFLDDDALPAEDFLCNLFSQLSKRRHIAAFCCRVLSHYQNIPKWYPMSGRYRLPLMGMFDLGESSRLLGKDDPLPIGSSLILRKDLFERYGYFDTRFGYNKRKFFLTPGEDTSLTLSLINGGEKFLYIHNCIINHYPEKVRFTHKTLLRIYAGQGFHYGVTDYEQRHSNNDTLLARVPIWYHKEFASALIRSLYSLIKRERVAFYYYHLHFAKIVGRYFGYLRTHRDAKPTFKTRRRHQQ